MLTTRGGQKKSERGEDSKETEMLKKDPTLPVGRVVVVSEGDVANGEQARSHGNEPSKGAKIDAELQAEEEEYLKKKGKA